MAAENGVGESHGARTDAASMRPRRMAAENVPRQPRGHRLPHASMRPRRMAAENAVSASPSGALGELQ